ncbi:pilin [Micromonospora sp. NBC_01813]|uniref:pilin n=1 Tax=Micromonospora sp. NBC_01813 TaxID=2975988 RepID=UPI002DD9E4EB|nr:pilin [Micromonospora sp. NBC_01813]WSA06994.1 pilin [Micromonospora sp. NBC_01813]
MLRVRINKPVQLSPVRHVARLCAAVSTVVLVVAVPAAAQADPGGAAYLAANSLPVVITNLRNLIMGLLAGLATLFLVLAGVYWATAGGDPGQVEKAKGALRNALIGYGLAVLSPILLQLLQGVVGG